VISWRMANSAALEFIFDESGQRWTTNDARSCEIGGGGGEGGAAAALPPAARGATAHDAVKSTAATDKSRNGWVRSDTR
jgi:hypothetical protein